MPNRLYSFSTFLKYALLSFLFSTLLMGADAVPVPGVVAVKLSDRLYALTGAMANSAILIGDEGTLLIDSGEKPEMAARLQTAIESVTAKPVRLLINTHWHFDHVNGNEFFGSRGALMIGQDLMRLRVCPPAGLVPSLSLPAEALPKITFSKELTLYLNGEELVLIHPDAGAAHTDGDTIVFFRKANVIHMGDIYFEGLYPYIDVDAGGWSDGIVKAIDQILPLINEQTQVIPGHGPLSSKKSLEAYRAMMADVGAKVQAMIKAGKTLDEVKQAKLSEAYDKAWGVAWLKPEQFIEMVYNGFIHHQGH
jgi:glyoxylase-like metal-dependent hydrolase (beta-lactamase superfamily II)